MFVLATDRRSFEVPTWPSPAFPTCGASYGPAIDGRWVRMHASPSSHIRNVAEQSTVLPRASEHGGFGSTSGYSPPSWINRNTTLRFFLALGSAKIPGECQFITLGTDTAIVVELEDAIGSAPGFFLVGKWCQKAGHWCRG